MRTGSVRWGCEMSRYIDADAVVKALCGKCGWYENQCDTDKGFWCETRGLIDEAPSIDIVRCKECASYCGDGNKCLWGLLTADMGYCHHGYRGGDCITKQTEPQTDCSWK